MCPNSERPARVLAESLSWSPKFKHGGVLHTKHAVLSFASTECRLDVRRQDPVRVHPLVAQKPVKPLQLRLGHRIRKTDVWIRFQRAGNLSQPCIQPLIAKRRSCELALHQSCFFPHSLR